MLDTENCKGKYAMRDGHNMDWYTNSMLSRSSYFHKHIGLTPAGCPHLCYIQVLVVKQ